MKVVITGAAGRLGAYLIDELAGRGFEVRAADVVRPEAGGCEFAAMDLTQFEKLRGLFAGCDAVVHLARRRFPYTESGFDRAAQRWRMPDLAGDAERFNHNAAITYNVLAAACASGARKIVCGSSLAVYGFYYSPSVPDYLPIDESHPRRPQDPYGISKLVGEDLCDAFAREGAVRIASLRFSGIYTEAHRRLLLERQADPVIRGTGALWSYIDVRDAATACRLALERDFDGHETFNICAPVTMMAAPTRDLARRYLPRVEIRGLLGGNTSGYDTSKAERRLGFTAKFLLAS